MKKERRKDSGRNAAESLRHAEAAMKSAQAEAEAAKEAAHRAKLKLKAAKKAARAAKKTSKKAKAALAGAVKGYERAKASAPKPRRKASKPAKVSPGKAAPTGSASKRLLAKGAHHPAPRRRRRPVRPKVQHFRLPNGAAGPGTNPIKSPAPPSVAATPPVGQPDLGGPGSEGS